MFNEPSLSVSIPPATISLSFALSYPAVLLFPHFILVCLSCCRHHVLFQDEVWTLTKTNLHHSSASLWFGSTVAKYIICSHHTFHLIFGNLSFAGPGSTFCPMGQFRLDSLDLTVWVWACMLAAWGKHAALFQLLSACNVTGTYFWHERNMWKRCLWSPHAQLMLFRQQDLAVLETFSTVLLALIYCTWLYLFSGRMASLSEHAAFTW